MKAEWLGWMSQGHEMYSRSHDLEAMGSNISWVDLVCIVLLST